MMGLSELVLRLSEVLRAEDPAKGLEQVEGVLSELGFSQCEAASADRRLVFTRDSKRFCFARSDVGADDPSLSVAQRLLDLCSELAAEREQHRRTAERMEMLSQASFEGIFIHSDGVVIDANQRLAEMLGYEAHELIGDQTTEMCVAPEDLAGVRARLRDRYEGEYVITGVRKDGSRFRAELQAKQGRLGERPVRVVAVRDVTERERMLQLLREGERQLADLAQQAFDFTVTHKNGLIIDLDGKFKELLGFERSELIGKMVADFSATRAATEQRIARGDTPAVEMYARTASGETVPLEIVAVSATREGQRVTLAGARDLRPQHRLAAERRKFEQQVERTQRLESLGVLAGGIAHDFNNLLVGIQGNAELLRESITEGPDAESVRGIVEGSRRAAELVAQMLAYAGRGGADRKESIDLGELVRELRHLLDATLSKKATVDLQIESNVHVLGNRARLTQVIMNLLTNASDALQGQPGKITVRVRPAPELDERWDVALGSPNKPVNGVLLEVQDDGAGMDEQTVLRVFEPFFSTKDRGHGLGLAACLGIVSSHAGSMLVESEPGKGSLFSVLLPASGPAQVAVDKQRPLRKGPPRQVLIVDDEQLVRAQLRRSLELRGFRVEEAGSGRDALAVLDERVPDLIVLDMTMRDMDGAHVLSEVRTRGLQVPVVLASGYMAPELERRLQQGAFQGFLRKPYAIAELLDVVEGALASA
jgi:PAS domain S-box-containing protein